MKWILQMGLGRCDSSSCTSPAIVPGEPVRLVLNGRHRWCWLCAWRRLQEKPPADLRPVEAPRTSIRLEDGRLVEANFSGFDRAAAGAELRQNILSRRQLERENANDSKLRQLGGDR